MLYQWVADDAPHLGEQEETTGEVVFRLLSISLFSL
jgi:hypothetical protein